MFSVFYVWSKTLTIANDDFTAGVPNATRTRSGGSTTRTRATTGRTTS